MGEREGIRIRERWERRENGSLFYFSKFSMGASQRPHIFLPASPLFLESIPSLLNKKKKKIY